MYHFLLVDTLLQENKFKLTASELRQREVGKLVLFVCLFVCFVVVVVVFGGR